MTKAKRDNLNKKTMRGSVKEYLWSDELTPSEISAIKNVPDIKDKPILDVGVGAGRTTRGLLRISKDYLGIDYVAEMTDKCKGKFLGVHFEQADARELSRYDDESFHTIFFSLNGLCMVDHVDRMLILKEFSRLLKPNGVFMFSAYNQNFIKHTKSFKVPMFEKTLNPLKLLVRSMRFLKNLGISIVNKIRYKSLEVKTDEYEIVNDSCHNYATMLYYTTPGNMKKQLNECGLSGELHCYGLNGEKIIDYNVEDDSIFYVVRK